MTDTETVVMLDDKRGIIKTPRYRFFDVVIPEGDWLKFAKFTTDDGRRLVERPLSITELRLAQTLRKYVPREHQLFAAQQAVAAIEGSDTA